MANEVIIEEYAYFDPKIQAPSIWLATQIKDIAVLSAKLNPQTTYVRIRSNGTAFWYTFGDSTASAAANTAGSSRLPADGFSDHVVPKNSDIYIDTAA